MCGGGEEGLAVNGWCGCFTLDEGLYVIYGSRDNISARGLMKFYQINNKILHVISNALLSLHARCVLCPDLNQ